MKKKNDVPADDTLDDIAITRPERRDAAVEMTAKDLHGGVIFCPNPRMPLWSNHPRVFIDLASHGEGSCPYCGTRYVLAGGAVARGH
jgi:uncharacterized Zn-finger protein